MDQQEQTPGPSPTQNRTALCGCTSGLEIHIFAVGRKAILGAVREEKSTSDVHGKHTFRGWVTRNCICNFGSTAEIQVQNWITFAGFEGFRNVECVLTKLVVGCANNLSAHLDRCESVQTIEDKPGGFRLS